MNKIGRFQYDDGSHSPLSNFYHAPFTSEDKVWPTVEHYFQGMKALDPFACESVRTCETPGQAKRMGRRVAMRTDWEAVKLHVMRHALILKFDTPDSPMGSYLLATGDALLEEGNTWNDTFWGVCDGRGANWLGHLLMARRAELRAETL